MANKFKKYMLLIWSENPDELVKFYTNILGLELIDKLELEDDYGYEVRVSDEQTIWIGYHSEVKGRSSEPFRHIVNLYTDNVQEWYDKVKNAGVEIISEPFLAPFATKEKQTYVATFLDPEGNCWQFMGKLK